MIPIYKPYLPHSVLEHAHKAVNSTWISSQGKYLVEAEEKLKQLLEVPYVQLVNNGTAATHLIAKVLYHKHPEIKKLFVPNNVYVAAWNAFKYDNRIELIPVDADVETWNFDLHKLKDAVEKCEEKCGVLVVHNVGNIVDVPALQKLLPSGTVIIEDSCEGFMGTYGGKYAGTTSLASSFSFFGNKTVTSGEGGAVILHDEDTANYIKSIQGQGQAVGKRYIHDQLGYNYRMTNIQAALLVGQLDVLPTIQEKKEDLLSYYRQEFGDMGGVRMQKSMPNTKHSNWMMGIRILGSPSYESVAEYLRERGVDSRPMFYPMSHHSHLSDTNHGDESIATLLSKECVILPSYPDMTQEDRKQVVEAVKDYCKELKSMEVTLV